MTLHIIQEKTKNDLILLAMPRAYKVGLFVFAVMCILTVGIKATPFIYFQF